MSDTDKLIKDFNFESLTSQDFIDLIFIDDSPRYLSHSIVIGTLNGGLTPAPPQSTGGTVLNHRVNQILQGAFHSTSSNSDESTFFQMATHTPPSTSEVTAKVIQTKSSMSDRVFFERISEQVGKDIARISASCEPVKREAEDPMAAARILSKGYFHG